MKTSCPSSDFPPALRGGLRGVTEILYLDSASSTQDVARGLAVNGARQGMLVVAGVQDRGRGRMEHCWDSSPGGLYMSLILRPKAAPADLGELSIAMASVVASALDRLYGIATRVKAPNDVLAYEPRSKKHLKISGILTESSAVGASADWVVVGIGVNLSNRLPRSLAATSVRRISGKTPSRDEFLSVFFDLFWDSYSKWELKAASRRA